MAPPPFQLKGEDGEKAISAKGFKRLEYAQEAMDYTSEILKHGAGNQEEALRKTKFNSNFRMQVARNDDYWTKTPMADKIGKQDPYALEAAKAELAEGGNCGEFANIAFQYLRYKAKGEWISFGEVDKFDHSFTFVGPAGRWSNMDNTAVADPWPTQPRAVMWNDHFAKGEMETPTSFTAYNHIKADGGNPKELIKAGLSLSEEGKKMLGMEYSEQKTEDKIQHEKDRKAKKDGLLKEATELKDEIETEAKILNFMIDQQGIDPKEQRKMILDLDAKMKKLDLLKEQHEAIELWMWSHESCALPGQDFDYQRTPPWYETLYARVKNWLSKSGEGE